MNAAPTFLVLASIAGIGLGVQATADSPDTSATGTRALAHFLEQSTLQHQYRGARRLEASGVGHRGWLDARTDFAPDTGFRYEVTAEGGSGYIRSHVLRSLLDEERSVLAHGAAGSVALSAANYRFTLEAQTADGLTAVRIEPLRKDRGLLDGRIFLHDDGGLVRVDGRLVKNPSFWTTHTHIVRSYRRVNGVPVPVSLQSTADLRFFGSSALQVTYRYSEIDQQPVADGRQAGVLPEAPGHETAGDPPDIHDQTAPDGASAESH